MGGWGGGEGARGQGQAIVAVPDTVAMARMTMEKRKKWKVVATSYARKRTM
jgi:hypothetical protein